MTDPLSVVRAGLRAASVPEVARIAGIPRRSVQGVLDGHVPSLTRAAEICRALGLELYIGPPRSVNETPESQTLVVREGARLDWSFPPAVNVPGDPFLMSIITEIAEHFAELNAPGRRAMLVRLKHCFPELDLPEQP